jgi:uncharacterized Tic20 family protein
MNTTPTNEDRIWAVLSHLSALALGMGILLPIIGWSEQRRKSKYSSFQCLQALGYQSLGYTFWLLFYIVILVPFLVVFVFAVSAAGDNRTVITAWAGIFVFIAFGLFGIYMLLPVIAAVACALGRDFRYPMMGNRLAKYLGYEPTDTDQAHLLIEAHEDRWVAAMGHFTVIIALWGLIAPLTTWILQGKRSLFLKFQSIQTTVYQAAVNIFYMGAGLVYFFGMIALLAMIGLEGIPNQNSGVGMLGLILFFMSLLVASVIILVIPLFHILGQWAGYRVLKGDDYQYPVIGKLVKRWIANKTSLAAGDGGSSLQGETS